jgi:hypothetical protein
LFEKIRNQQLKIVNRQFLPWRKVSPVGASRKMSSEQEGGKFVLFG